MTGKISDDAAADPTVAVTDGMNFAAEVSGVNKGPSGASIAAYIYAKVGVLTSKTIDAASNTISNISTAMFAANVVDTDATLAASSDTRLASQKAVKTFIGGLRLDQLVAPTADVSLNSHKLTNVTDPTGAQDAATKAYVDTVAQGLDVKPSVKAATTANITLSGTQTIDGIALVAGDRCLVKNQTTTSQNGVYVVASGSWTRATDADAWSELPGAFTIVEQGTVNADTGWVCTVDQGGTLGTTAIAFAQFAGVGTYSAGAGLALTGSQFKVDINGASAAAAVSDTDTTLVYQGASPLKQTFAAIKTWVQGIAFSAANLTSGTLPAARTNGHMNGTATNDDALTGEVGEYVEARFGGTTGTATMTIASPCVVTWTGHSYAGSAQSGVNWTAPVIFTTTGALPTGITAGTTYWLIGSTLSGNTFQIATSVANALAGTAINTSGSQSGTHTATTLQSLTSGTAAYAAAILLTAGDWDVGCVLYGDPTNASTSVTDVSSYLSLTPTTPTPDTTPGRFAQIYGGAFVPGANAVLSASIPRARFKLASATTVHLVALSLFTVSTMSAYGFVAARRAR